MRVLNEASLDVNAGQLAETLARGRPHDVSEVLAIQYHKTARAFRHAGRVASLHARQPVPEGTLVALELAALAFQAVDDWLDLLPPSDQTGKSAARDAYNGVPSFVRVDPRAPRRGGLPGPPPGEAVSAASDAASAILAQVKDPLATLPLGASRALVHAYAQALADAAADRVEGTITAPLVAQLTAQIQERLSRFSVELLATPD